MKRRQLLWASTAIGGAALWPEARLLAQQAQDFIEGPPVSRHSGTKAVAPCVDDLLARRISHP